MVATLDIPIRQVLIESRIVIADDTFNRDLGVRFRSVLRMEQVNGSNRTRRPLVGGALPGRYYGLRRQRWPRRHPQQCRTDQRIFIVDLPIGSPASAIKFAVVSIPDFILQLELQALQLEGRGEVISNPRVW